MLRRLSLIPLFVFLSSSILFGQQAQPTKAQVGGGIPRTTHARGRGCVRQGKEEGCFILHDIKQHRYYDLSFDSTPNKPDLNTAISFEGIGYQHDTRCSQGHPVHVHDWKPLPGKCSQPAGAKAKTQ
jgi:hypothetical protein